jgi:hypothetical protein
LDCYGVAAAQRGAVEFDIFGAAGEQCAIEEAALISQAAMDIAVGSLQSRQRPPRLERQGGLGHDRLPFTDGGTFTLESSDCCRHHRVRSSARLCNHASCAIRRRSLLSGS